MLSALWFLVLPPFFLRLLVPYLGTLRKICFKNAIIKCIPQRGPQDWPKRNLASSFRSLPIVFDLPVVYRWLAIILFKQTLAPYSFSCPIILFDDAAFCMFSLLIRRWACTLILSLEVFSIFVTKLVLQPSRVIICVTGTKNAPYRNIRNE